MYQAVSPCVFLEKKYTGDRRKYSVLLSIVYTRQHTPDTSTSMALHIYNVTMQEFQPSFFICCLKKSMLIEKIDSELLSVAKTPSILYSPLYISITIFSTLGKR